VENPLDRWRHVRCFCVRIRGATARVEKLAFRPICGGLLKQILTQLKNFFPKKSKCAHPPRTRRHFYAKFDVLRPSQY